MVQEGLRWLECNQGLATSCAKKKVDIAPCSGKIFPECMARYVDLYTRKKEKEDSTLRRKEVVQRSIESKHARAAISLESSRKRSKTSTCSSTGNKSSIVINGSPSNTCISSITTTATTASKKPLIQMKVYGGASADVDQDTKLTVAIADLIHSCGLPFRLADHPKFRKMVMISRTVSSKYKFPDRNQIATKLLDINYSSYMEEAKDQLCKDINIFGLSFYGDGATVRKMPLINVMASGAYLHTSVLEIVNCQSHMERGGKKDAEYIASIFRPHIDEFEKKNSNCVDYCTFDGAANVQKAGRVLEVFL